MKWSDVTVFQWQQLIQIFENETTEFDTMCRCAAVLHNKTDNQIDSLSLIELNKLIKEIEFIHGDIEQKPQRYIKANGKRYRCIYDVRQIPAARYIESKHFGKDVNSYLHLIAASLVIPQKRKFGIWVDEKYDASKHHAYAEDMLSAPITAVLGSVVFFCNVYLNWIENMKDYLIEQMMLTMSKMEAEQTYRDLWNSTAGFIKPNWLVNLNELN